MLELPKTKMIHEFGRKRYKYLLVLIWGKEKEEKYESIRQDILFQGIFSGHGWSN